MFTTKFDANSIIRDFAFGHSNRVNAIFLLGIADALSKSTTPIQGLDKSIVFSWFNSENWGYAGSQRFVEDISKEFVCKDTNPTATCPQNLGNSCSLPCHSTTAFQKLKFDRIESVIDVDIGGILHSKIDGASNIYLHVDQSNVETNKLISAFQSTIIEPGYNNSSPLNITIAAAVRPGEPNFKLPPSSSMAYLQKKTSLPAIVLTDYRTEFSNPYN
jgi:nicastrin